MLRVMLFNLLYLSCCSYAVVRGGSPERIGASILIANFQISHWLIAPLPERYGDTEWGMFGIDFAAFAALYVLSLFSCRYWPMWMAAVQGVVALSHLASFRSDVIPVAYGNTVALWGYVLLLMLLAATRRHRIRLRRYGIDPAWAWRLPDAYRRGGPPDEKRSAEGGRSR